MSAPKRFIETIKPLREGYHPVQPAVTSKDEHVTYEEFLPADELRPFIYCYWQLKTDYSLKSPFIYRVIADGCIDIFFEMNNPSESYVMGFCRKYTEFPLDQMFNYVGICFLPTMFPQLFHVDAANLSNRFQNLRNVAPKTAHFIGENIQPELSSAQIKSLLDEYFAIQLHGAQFNNDTRLYNAMHEIIRRFGMINVEKDINTGISARQLRRLFAYYVGDTTKVFAQVVRFQSIFQAKPSTQSLKKNKLFIDGYFDQSHFIKEFKNFYGVTPSKAFGR